MRLRAAGPRESAYIQAKPSARGITKCSTLACKLTQVTKSLVVIPFSYREPNKL